MALTSPTTPSADAASTGAVVASVVGIGSSAGGLEALHDLLESLTPSGDRAYVVAQHLSPSHESLLVDLLSPDSPLPVLTAVDGAELLPNCVFVAPPQSDVTVSGGFVRVTPSNVGPGPSPSIDQLFASIADSWGSRGIAIVLSGTGSDGAQGLRAVKAAGGFTIVQTPSTAKFEAMPRAAIALIPPDEVLAPNEIGPALADLIKPMPDPIDHIGQPATLATMVNVLRRVTGVDFSEYKDSTLQRQLDRRMGVRQLATADAYLSMLKDDRDEAQALMENILVTVTSFFRDPVAFETLQVHLSDYVSARMSADQLRIWVPGCATGEEVYTVAMIADAALGHPTQLSRHLKIFGTDLDEASLAVARRGVYPVTAVDRIPQDFATRHLVRVDAGVAVADALKDCTVFARHNIGSDPPFPRLDVVSFRNTCIYFKESLQIRAMESIRFALVPGGLLLLGSTEVVPASVAGLTMVDPQVKLFERSMDLIAPFVATSTVSRWTQIPASRPAGPARVPAASAPVAHSALLQSVVRTLAGPSVVLDCNHDVIEVIGDVSPYCRLAEGQLSSGVTDLLLPELQAEARALMLMVRSGSALVEGSPLAVDGMEKRVRLSVRSLPDIEPPMTLLSFTSVPAAPVMGAAEPTRVILRDQDFDNELKRLETELLRSQETLSQSLAELETANEELQATTEELQGSSEELQSSNEELETANEELQATNEELGGVNAQLRGRADELESVNTDLENIQGALTQGLVIVDADLRITRFTPSAVRVFALLKGDIGRSILDVPVTVSVDGLERALRAAVGGATTQDLELLGADSYFLAQVQPYEASDDSQSHGAILTLNDVTELIRTRETAQSALAELREVTEAIDEVVWKRDPESMELRYIRGRVGDLTGFTTAELEGKRSLLDSLIPADERDRVAAARLDGTGSWSVLYAITRRDGLVRDVRESGIIIRSAAEDFAVGTLVDVTDRVAVERQAADLAAIFESVYQTRMVGVAIVDEQGCIVMANEQFGRIVGLGGEDLCGKPLSALGEPKDPHGLPRDTVVGSESGGADATPWRVLRPDGSVRWVTLDLRSLPRRVGESAAVAILMDVTTDRAQSEQLAVLAQHDSLTGLANRSTIREACRAALMRSSRANGKAALAWIDVDRFKEINDHEGHSVGDGVLREVAYRLQQVTRQGGSVGRLGGDEFAVVITDFEDVADLETALDRVVASMRAPILTDHVVCNVSASIGVAVYPDDGLTVDELMRAADTAMYEAKRAGGDRYSYFQSRMTVQADQRRTQRAEIASAIRDESFMLHYQPIVSARDGSFWGAEALLRLIRDDEVVSASEFIPFCESSGQIRALGPITLNLLRRDVGRARERGIVDPRPCLNLSVSQLEDRTFADEVALRGLDDLGRVVIEVTESVFLPDRDRALGVVRLLRGLGAQLSVDDFGIGFSNLRMLKGLAPDIIKLDRSFLTETPDGGGDVAVLKAAIDMAHAIGATIIAEGIEFSGSRELVCGLGVDLLQGFAIARPMPLETFLDWIETNAPTEMSPQHS